YPCKIFDCVIDYLIVKTPDLQSATLLQRLGIAPGLLALVIIADCLLFSGEAASLGASLILSIPAGMVIAVIATIWQKRLYHDTIFRAILKGLTLGVLTAIPTPLGSIVAIFGAVLPILQKESAHLNHPDSPSVEDKNPDPDNLRRTHGRVIK
ncbi:MAG: hypothetical protein RR419_08545, partial [Akkermansia sp.]